MIGGWYSRQRFKRNLSNAPILKLAKSCTFHHGLVCFLCKKYVLILSNQNFGAVGSASFLLLIFWFVQTASLILVLQV